MGKIYLVGVVVASSFVFVGLSFSGCSADSLLGPPANTSLDSNYGQGGDGHNNVDNGGDGHNNVDNGGDGHNNKS